MIFHPYGKAKYEWFEPLDSICPTNEYKTVITSELPLSIFPDSLIQKVPALFLINSGNSGTISWFLIDCHRRDGKQIDQQPLITWFDHANGQCFAGFIDHGNWRGRTYDPTITSGLVTAYMTSGAVECGSGLWLRSTQGRYGELKHSFPREELAFLSSMRMLTSYSWS